MILSMVPSVWAADETKQDDTDDTAAQEPETPGESKMSGNCGATKEDTVTWELTDDDGDGSYTLTISGNGKTCANFDDVKYNGNGLMKTFGNKIKKIVVQDGVTYLGANLVRNTESVVVEIPASVTEMNIGDEGYSTFGNSYYAYDNATQAAANVAQIIVDEKNPSFKMVDGVLFSKDGKTLYCYTDEAAADYVVPNGVEIISDKAFSRSEKLTSVAIPEGVTYIGWDCFDKSYNLSGTLVIPASVKTLGSAAFSQLPNLTGIEFKATGLANYHALRSNNNPPSTGIKTVTFAEGTTVIPDDLCAALDLLETVYVPESLTAIGERAFSGCKSLNTFTLTEKTKLTKINAKAFSDTQLTEIIIPDTVTEIGDDAFSGCSKLAKVTISPDSQLSKIGANAFAGIAVTSLYLPKGVTEWGQYAFGGTRLLEAVDLTAVAGSVTNGGNAFYNTDHGASLGSYKNRVYYMAMVNDDLRTALGSNSGLSIYAVTNGGTFPADTSFESGKLATPTKGGCAFAGWYTKDGTNDDWGGKVTSSTKLTAGATYYAKWNTAVLSGDCGAEGNENNVHWALTKNTDGTTYTLIISGTGAMADYSCNITRDDAAQPWRESQTGVAPSAISKVVVENGVTNIGKFACNGMNCVKEYDIAATVQTISPWGIDTQSAEKFTLNENKNFIVDEDGVLMNAARDTMIAYPGGKAQIAEYEIPASVKTLASGVFVGSKIDKIVIPNTVESAAAWSFSASTAKEVVFDVNVKTLPNGMFSGMANLTQLTFGEHAKIEEIANAALSGLDSIKTFDLPASLKKIGEMGLGQNTSMTELTLPDGLEEIGGQAFKAVLGVEGNLSKLTFGKNMPKMTNDEGSCQILLGQNKLDTVDMTRCTSEADSIDCFNNRGYNGIPVVYTANEAVATKAKTANNSLMAYAVTNGGTFPDNTKFEAGKLATPVKDGYRFDDWYKKSDFSDGAVTTAEAGQTYYAKWGLKAEQSAPAAPTLKDRTYTSITLNTIEGAQYRCNGGAWRASPEFTGLTAGTAYTFEAYYAETNDCKASPVSEKAEFSTLRRSSGSGSSYAVSAPSSVKNGTVTVSPKSAGKGSTVTVTVKPDSGYVLESLSVVDQNGSKIKLTDKGDGKYTFTMPGSKVEVKAAFMEDNSVLNFFYDVPNDAYYYEAVK